MKQILMLALIISLLALSCGCMQSNKMVSQDIIARGMPLPSYSYCCNRQYAEENLSADRKAAITGPDCCEALGDKEKCYTCIKTMDQQNTRYIQPRQPDYGLLFVQFALVAFGLVLPPIFLLLLAANLIVWLVRKKGFLPAWLWIGMLAYVFISIILVMLLLVGGIRSY